MTFQSSVVFQTSGFPNHIWLFPSTELAFCIGTRCMTAKTHSGILVLANTFLVFISLFALENKVPVDTEVKEVNKY